MCKVSFRWKIELTAGRCRINDFECKVTATELHQKCFEFVREFYPESPLDIQDLTFSRWTIRPRQTKQIWLLFAVARIELTKFLNVHD